MGSTLSTSPNLFSPNLPLANLPSASLPSTKLSSKAAMAVALGVIAALMGGMAAGPAAAEAPPPTSLARTVAYGDLDLSRPADAQTLEARIRVAAKEACGGAPDHSPLYPRSTQTFQACASDAASSALAHLGQSAEAALTPANSPVSVIASR